MDELMWLRLFGGTLGGGIDWAAVLLFLGIAAVYFVAPTLGYSPYRRGAIGASLYLLVGYAAMSLFQLAMQYLQVLDKTGQGRETSGIHILFVFALLKTLLFVIAMLMFAIGLQSLRLRPSREEEE
jgi:hypothetical protein